MNEKPNTPPQMPANPLSLFPDENVRGEVPACPTGLSDQLAPELEEGGLDTQEVHGKLEVEKLEGRQESGRED
jgi:hypothetical protein